MKPVDYFAQHSVFRYEDFASLHQRENQCKPATTRAVLRQHVKAGRLLHIRRGLYAVIPKGGSQESLNLNPFVIASQLVPDAIVSHHGALQYHGKAYSVFRRIPFFTNSKLKAFDFRGIEYIPVPAPPSLRELENFGGGVIIVQYEGAELRVTTLERTLVDVLDAPRYNGGWEEIWRSLESVEFFDIDAITDYAFLLGSAVTIAKVGFYLEQHREELMVEERHLVRLSQRVPKNPLYLERGKRESGKLMSRWNLIVPDRMLNREWISEI